MLWWNEAIKSPGMVLGSWLANCSGTEMPVGSTFPTSLLCLPQLHRAAGKDRRLSPVIRPSNECQFAVEFHSLIPLILGLSWILESLCHISAFALFLRNAEAQSGAVVAVFTVPKHLSMVRF